MTVVAAGAASIHWLARPHIFTFFFLVLFQEALERVREGRTHWRRIPYLAMLPVVTILWTNLHGSYTIGLALILPIAFEAVWYAPATGRRLTALRWTAFAAAAAACCAAVALVSAAPAAVMPCCARLSTPSIRSAFSFTAFWAS